MNGEQLYRAFAVWFPNWKRWPYCEPETQRVFDFVAEQFTLEGVDANRAVRQKLRLERELELAREEIAKLNRLQIRNGPRINVYGGFKSVGFVGASTLSVEDATRRWGSEEDQQPLAMSPDLADVMMEAHWNDFRPEKVFAMFETQSLRGRKRT